MIAKRNGPPVVPFTVLTKEQLRLTPPSCPVNIAIRAIPL